MVERSPEAASAFGFRSDRVGHEPLFDLNRLSFAVRSRYRFIAAGAVLGLAVGAGLSIALAGPPKATTKLQLVHADAQQALARSEQLVAVAQQQTPIVDPLKSSAVAQCGTADVAQRAALVLGMDSLDLLKAYTCREVAADIVSVQVEASSEDEALRRAQALSDAFLESRRVSGEASAADQADEFVIQRAAQTRNLADVVERTTQSYTVADAAGLLKARDQLAEAIDSLTTSDRDRRTEAAVELTRVFDPPRMVPSAGFDDIAKAGLVGLFLGAAGALGLAVVAGVTSERPVRRRDVARALGAPVLMDVRRPPLRRGRRSEASADLGPVAAALGRLIAPAPGEVALLHIGCAQVATALAEHMSSLPQPSAPRVGSLSPSPGWPALAEFGRLAVLAVRAGHGSESELHAIARDLADAEIEVLGIVLVDAHPRDHTEGSAGPEYYEAMARHREWVRSGRAGG